MEVKKGTLILCIIGGLLLTVGLSLIPSLLVNDCEIVGFDYEPSRHYMDYSPEYTVGMNYQTGQVEHTPDFSHGGQLVYVPEKYFVIVQKGRLELKHPVSEERYDTLKVGDIFKIFKH